MRASVLSAAVGAVFLLGTPATAGQTYNWSGLYIGAHVGYASGDATTTDDVADWGTDPKFIGPFNYDLDGGFGGGTVGVNWQHSSLVLGFEADLGYLDLSGSRLTDSSVGLPNYQTLNVDGGFYALLGGRAGIAFGSTLVYGKGGWAYYDTEATQTTTKPGFQTHPTDSFTGWAYGAGIEQAVGDGWSLKAEYLRFNFGTEHGDQTSLTDPPIGHVYEFHTDINDVDSFKVGLNYKFGEREAPVPLK
jgi:outer membrane immunogenic protein